MTSKSGAFQAVVEIKHPRAAELLAAVDADNTKQVRCTVVDDLLRCEIAVDGIGTLLASLDDLLACLEIASGVLDASEGGK
jgi:hypothetical protein